MLKLPRIRSRHGVFTVLRRNHAEVFMERYDRLRAWALRLTEDSQQAEDILHDSFLQFTLSNTDLGQVENLDAYLHGIVRNVYVSAVRRAASGGMQRRSVVEFDSAELGYCLIDPSLRIQAREELRIICDYACARKETSTAGSVLILRFFHGYYPAEIARIVRCTRQAVANRLLVARSEAKLELASVVARAAAHDAGALASTQGAKTRQEFLAELRESILQSRKGACLSKESLDAAYAQGNPSPLACETLAHIVSCRKCLDDVNRRLGLPLLAERHPNDTIGPDGGTGADGNDAAHLKRCAREVFEHLPRELSVSVNGHPIGSQPVSGGTAKQSLNIALQETVTFVEVFSELGVRLLMMEVAEPSQTGAMEQSVTTRLSDGRTLTASLDQSGCWPKLNVAYAAPALGEAAEEIATAVPDQEPAAHGVGSLLGRWWQSMRGWGYWVPAATAAATLCVLLGLVFLHKSPSNNSAAMLLNKSAAFEQKAILPESVAFQAVSFVETKVNTGEVIASRRIETWRRAQPPSVARRIFNEKGKLVAGEWTNPDGASVVYQRNKMMTLAPLQAPKIVSAAMMSEVPLTAKDFVKLVGNTANLSVSESPDAFIVHYQNSAKAATPCITQASLTLRRVDLHPIEQSVVVKSEQGAREYRYVETKYVQEPANAVDPAVFHPDAGVFMPALPLRILPRAMAATPELEVEVLKRLDDVHALAGEQITITAAPAGPLKLEGIVDTPERKAEILRSIGALRNQPALKVNIETAEEAQLHAPPVKGTPIELQGMDVVEHDIPIASQLRGYFSTHGIGGEDTAAQIRQLTSSVTDASMHARLDAMALNELVTRFSDQQLAAMPAETREELKTMIRNHAQDFLARTRELSGDLAPVFPAVAGAQAEVTGPDIGNLRNNVARLLELASATDDAVGRSFRISVDDHQTVMVNTAEFWRRLRRAEQLATAVLKNSEK